MDFILSLTHFCEVHGPTSVLCSQVVPTACSQCDLDPASDLSSSNDTSFSSQHASPSLSLDIHRDHGPEKPSSSHEAAPAADLDPVAASPRCTTSSDLPQPPGSAPASAPSTARRIEDLPWFLGGSYGRAADKTETLSGFRGAEGDTCSSCRLSIPEDVSKQLPPGAPGTLKEDGKVRNGSPVLRSREMVHSCSGSHAEHDDSQASHVHLQSSSSPSSVRSSYSSADSACHPHIVTYLSLRGPPTPSDYALLRRASIRTLSCELLPRGLSSGPLSFGDTATGYTIAYVFRLPDPMARGKRRSYALVALAGKDSGRAFRACPIIWRVFGRIANSLVSAAEKHQEREKNQEEEANSGSGGSGSSTVQGRRITPVSSFLTGRTVDPDGRPRRAGQVRARNLTEIVGNEYIFAELHGQFVALLQQLGGMFGGLRGQDPRSSAASEAAFDEAGEGYFATTHSSSSSASVGDASGKRVPNKNGTSTSSHVRVASDAPASSSAGLSSSPKPIPISQRRQVAAT